MKLSFKVRWHTQGKHWGGAKENVSPRGKHVARSSVVWSFRTPLSGSLALLAAIIYAFLWLFAGQARARLSFTVRWRNAGKHWGGAKENVFPRGKHVARSSVVWSF